MQFKQRPYNLLLIAFMIMCIGGLFSSNALIDIMIYDTYFVIPFALLIWVASILLFFSWFLYWKTKGKLYSNKLMWLHVILTLLSSLTLLALPYLTSYNDKKINLPRMYFDDDDLLPFNKFDNLSNLAFITFAFLWMIQLLYLINLIVGFYKGSYKTNRS